MFILIDSSDCGLDSTHVAPLHAALLQRVDIFWHYYHMMSALHMPGEFEVVTDTLELSFMAPPSSVSVCLHPHSPARPPAA